MKYWMCLKCREAMHNGGWHQLPETSDNKTCPVRSDHGNMFGPYDHWDPQLPFAARRVAQQNWKRLIEKALKITAGSFKGSLHLKEPYYLELLDPKHRYGPEVKLLFDKWAAGPKNELFFDWIEKEPSPLKKGVIQVPQEHLKNHHQIQISGNKIVKPVEFEHDWAKAVSNGSCNVLIFVMDRINDIYVGLKKRQRFQHSSFFAGRPVKMAGTFTVNQSWVITRISNSSGHYAPSAKHLVAFLEIMKDKGLTLDNVNIDYWDGNKWAYQGKAAEFESWCDNSVNNLINSGMFERSKPNKRLLPDSQRAVQRCGKKRP